MIKIVLFTGGEGLSHHPAKENALKSKVEKRYPFLLGEEEEKEGREVPLRKRGGRGEEIGTENGWVPGGRAGGASSILRTNVSISSHSKASRGRCPSHCAP